MHDQTTDACPPPQATPRRRRDAGQTQAEYAIALAVITLGVVFALASLATPLEARFGTTADRLRTSGS